MFARYFGTNSEVIKLADGTESPLNSYRILTCALRFVVFNGVYPPSEDTWMLIDCINEHPKWAIDVCCGSGLISLTLADRGARVLAIDIDPNACANTAINARINDLSHMIDVICSDLCSCLNGKFDAIFCNPPYLPFDNSVPEAKWWFGGKGGVEISCRLIEEAKLLLVKGGSIFLVISSLSDYSVVYSALEKYGFKWNIVRSRPHDSEEIKVIRATLD